MRCYLVRFPKILFCTFMWHPHSRNQTGWKHPSNRSSERIPAGCLQSCQQAEPVKAGGLSEAAATRVWHKGRSRGCCPCSPIFLRSNDQHCKLFAKLDFKNAFNTLHQENMLKLCQEVNSEHSELLIQIYRKDSFLLHRDQCITSQQRDVIGCMVFSIGIHPLIRKPEFNS